MAEEDIVEVPIEQNPDADPVDGGTPERVPFPVYDEKIENLVPVFESHPDGKKWLIKAGSDIIKKFDSGFSSTQEYRERFADMWRIFAGELKPKEGPMKDASNAHLPVMMENISRLTNRAFGELFGDWSNVFNYLPNGPDDDAVASALSLHGNWQIREQIPEFKRQMERQMLMFFGPGDVTMHTYWNEKLARPCVEVLSPDEFVTPYVQTSVSPDWSDVPWRAKVLNLYRHELQSYRGLWFGVEDVLKRKEASWDDEPHQLVTTSVSNTQGVRQDDEAGAPHKVIWYEGWEDLPSQEAQRFVRAVVHYDTRKILQLVIHERANWQDKIRFDRQLQEFNQYQEAVMASQAAEQEVAALEQQFQQQMAMQAIGPEAVNQIGPELEQRRAMIPPPPPPPQWLAPEMDGPEPAKMEPISLFSHGVCLEPMVGNLGYGYGRVQCDLNKAANVMFQHFTDGASLAAGRMIMTGNNVSIQGGMKVGPAVHLKVDGLSGTDLAQEIIEFKFAPPEPALMMGVDKLIQIAESSIQAPGILSGEAGKSGETYRGVSARIEQATKNLSVSTRKNGNVVETVIKQLAYLNSVFLRDEEIFLVTNHLGKTEEARVGRKMYERGYRVTLRADLRFATLAQRIAEADELTEMANANPLLQQNLHFQWHAYKKSLEARGRHDMIPSLGPEPPAPTTPFAVPAPPPPMPPQQIDPATGQPVAQAAPPPGQQPVLQ
jgi:hypothetical protein